MSAEQVQGWQVGGGILTAIIGVGIAAWLLIRTSDELAAMKARREVRRVRLARSRDCCAAHGLDVYGGDE